MDGGHKQDLTSERGGRFYILIIELLNKRPTHRKVDRLALIVESLGGSGLIANKKDINNIPGEVNDTLSTIRTLLWPLPLRCEYFTTILPHSITATVKSTNYYQR